MITRSGFDTDSKCPFVDCRGLSTDEKPLGVPNGSTFFEMDSGKVYMFDEESKTWLEV